MVKSVRNIKTMVPWYPDIRVHSDLFKRAIPVQEDQILEMLEAEKEHRLFNVECWPGKLLVIGVPDKVV